MKKTLFVILIIGLAFGTLFAAGTKEEAKAQKEIVILVKNMGNGFFDAVFKGSEEAAPNWVESRPCTWVPASRPLKDRSRSSNR